LAVSATVSPREIWVSLAVRVMASPPSCLIATSKESRVRVEGF
jgi:hypothetical protein